jgi:hypothetical protein
VHKRNAPVNKRVEVLDSDFNTNAGTKKIPYTDPLRIYLGVDATRGEETQSWDIPSSTDIDRSLGRWQSVFGSWPTTSSFGSWLMASSIGSWLMASKNP